MLQHVTTPALCASVPCAQDGWLSDHANMSGAAVLKARYQSKSNYGSKAMGGRSDTQRCQLTNHAVTL
jgi:hypothetical protein